MTLKLSFKVAVKENTLFIIIVRQEANQNCSQLGMDNSPVIGDSNDGVEILRKERVVRACELTQA